MIRLEDNGSPTSASKIIKGVIILLIILLIGTVGFHVIEEWSFVDALYMTVITISTVGFHEVEPLSVNGRMFTIFLIFFGMGIIVYILGMVTQTMVDFQMRSIIGRRKLGLKIRTIKDHYIICGFGRLGTIICRELQANNIPMIVIDNSPISGPVLESEGIPYFYDDATVEEALIKARIEKAKGLISVVASDADNLFITMTARGLNPDLYILARADEEHTEKKLMRAGANKVVLPYFIGGHKMAQSIVKPAVTDFIEFIVHNKDLGLEIEELAVSENSRLNGVALMDSGIRQDMDIIFVAIRKNDGKMMFNPSSKTRIEAGDTLISLGKIEDLGRLDVILSGK